MFRKISCIVLFGFLLGSQLFSCSRTSCSVTKKETPSSSIEKCETTKSVCQEKVDPACCLEKCQGELTKSLPNFEELFTQITQTLSGIIDLQNINVADIAALVSSLSGLQVTVDDIQTLLTNMQTQLYCVAAYVGAAEECSITPPSIDPDPLPV